MRFHRDYFSCVQSITSYNDRPETISSGLMVNYAKSNGHRKCHTDKAYSPDWDGHRSRRRRRAVGAVAFVGPSIGSLFQVHHGCIASRAVACSRVPSSCPTYRIVARTRDRHVRTPISFAFRKMFWQITIVAAPRSID